MTEKEKHHLYVINKFLLSSKDVMEIESRMEKDREFDEYISSIRKIISDSEDANEISINADEVYEKLFGNTGYGFELSSMFDNNDEDNLKLAAMNVRDVKDEFVYFNTFATADNFILIRVLKNPFSSNYRFYIISENMELVKNAVLKINDTGDVFIADDKGVVSIYSEELPKKIKISVMIPADVFSIDTENLKSSYKSERKNSGTEISVKLMDTGFSINFDKDYLKNKTCYMMIENDDREIIVPEIADERKIALETLSDKNHLIKLVIINNK